MGWGWGGDGGNIHSFSQSLFNLHNPLLPPPSEEEEEEGEVTPREGECRGGCVHVCVEEEEKIVIN